MPCASKSHRKTTHVDPKLTEVFERLKLVLAPQAKYLRVLENTPTKYALGCDFDDRKRKQTMMISAVYLRKDYVTLCLGTMHMDPASARSLSVALRDHKSGMTCFHFRELDEDLFQEVEGLAEHSFEGCCERGLLPVEPDVALTRA